MSILISFEEIFFLYMYIDFICHCKGSVRALVEPGIRQSFDFGDSGHGNLKVLIGWLTLASTKAHFSDCPYTVFLITHKVNLPR